MKHRKTTPTTKSRNLYLYGIVITGVIGYILFLIIRSFSQSLFIKQKDRINFIVYGQNTAVYSIGLIDGQDYILPFPAELKVNIPGGYGSYRVGSIGKLVKLDKKPDIYKQTFSLAVGTFVPYYFYENKDEIYYQSNEPTKKSFSPGRNVFMFFNTNASFFDKLYFTLLMSQRDYERFKLVTNSGDFNQDEFLKRTLGLLYAKTYRSEKKNIQLFFSETYKTAGRIGSILEGSGIRVSDISYEEPEKKNCVIKEGSSMPSFTSQTLIDFFHCERWEGDTGVYDILFYLGEKIEREWEV